jgi:tetratricopeptide (TPR) repeat protein
MLQHTARLLSAAAGLALALGVPPAWADAPPQPAGADVGEVAAALDACDRVLDAGSEVTGALLGACGHAVFRQADERDAERALRAWRRAPRQRKLLHEPAMLNGVAWYWAHELPDPPKPLLELAFRLARHACELTGRQNPHYLDTLAQVHHRLGHHAKALEIIDEAIALAPEDEHYQHQKQRFQAAATPTVPRDPQDE